MHPRVALVKTSLGATVTYSLGSGLATVTVKNENNLCSEEGANSRLLTYQGKLSDGAQPANGTYDLQFQLFDQPTGGTAWTSLITLDDVPVTNGVFTVQLDLGANAQLEGGSVDYLKLNPKIMDAGNSFFEISVRAGTSTGAYTVLTPRQPLTAVPLAMRANTANTAFRANNADLFGGLEPNQFIRNSPLNPQQPNSNFNISGNGIIGGSLTVSGTINGTVSNATNATNATNAAQLGGIAANQYLTTTSANSNLIQNTTTQQANSNFNISGSGIVGGNLTANTVNANSSNNLLLNADSSSPVGTWLTLNNSTSGGRNWGIISTGANNGEGAGKLLFYDRTNTTGRLLLSDAGANITGNLTVSGSISGASKNFKIDHPLDPLNKTLTYTSVESPDMMNIYNGNITTDGRGEAIVTMPAYFEALNKDFRYQLTVIGTFAQAIVFEKIKGNQFKIKTDKPNVEVSWQVTGIRHDKFAEDKQTQVEQEKTAADKGKCLYAPACGKEKQ